MRERVCVCDLFKRERERERERESLAREFDLKNPTPPGAAQAIVTAIYM